MGVTTKKNIIPIIIGEINLPKYIPNLNQILFKGVSNLELINPNIKLSNEDYKTLEIIKKELELKESEVIKKLRPLTKKVFDVHLMISPVDNFIKDFSKAGADIITFHPEATPDISNTISLIKKEGKKVGLSLKPKSKIELIEKHLEQVDLILIMSVEPGFVGQGYIEGYDQKIKNEDFAA